MASTEQAVGTGQSTLQELAKRHVALAVLPFTAALLGAALGGLASRLGWTSSPGYGRARADSRSPSI